MSFKRFKAITKDPSVLVHAIQFFCGTFLHLSSDLSCVRRVIPFSPSTFLSDLTLGLHVIHAAGFPFSTSIPSIKSFFSRFGQVVHIERSQSSSSSALAVLVEFSEYETMITTLTKNLLYEDNPIIMAPHQKPSTWPVNCKVAEIKRTAYPKNRLVTVALPTMDDDSLPLPALISRITEKMAKYASVHSVTPAESYLVIRFQKPVAKDVINMIRKVEGGFSIEGDLLNIEAVDGLDEKIFWDVEMEKVQLRPLQLVQPSTLISRNKYKKRRTTKVSKKKLKEDKNAGKSAGSKREREDSDEDMDAAGQSDKESIRNKKVKTGEDLADLINAWGM